MPDGLDPASPSCSASPASPRGSRSTTARICARGRRSWCSGAGGVVGQVAVQAAKLLGAGRVVAAARSEERLDRALQQGADATVQIGAVDDLASAFREAGGGGVDVVVDPVWGEPAVAALDAMNVRGRLVQLGQSAGATGVVPSALIRGKTLDVLGTHELRRAGAGQARCLRDDGGARQRRPPRGRGRAHPAGWRGGRVEATDELAGGEARRRAVMGVVRPGEGPEQHHNPAHRR